MVVIESVTERAIDVAFRRNGFVRSGCSRFSARFDIGMCIAIYRQRYNDKRTIL